jgi:RNA polymerase sigma-70 factor (ECF subfamily)
MRYKSKRRKRSSEIFLLNRKDHLTNNEIAQWLGISKRFVENQISHGPYNIEDSI